MTKRPDWIAVDWGTTHLRAWLMAGRTEVIERRDSDQGMGRLGRDQFEPALDALFPDVKADGPLPALICGMAGAQQGWAEAPYIAAPCAPPGAAAALRVPAARWDVRILPGVKQTRPADVMRGEETQIAGFLASEPDFEGSLCLPGTHNKWVKISAGKIAAFRTFMTGEIFNLLSEHSLLRHSVQTDGWDEAAFLSAAQGAISRPADLAAALFSLRAEGLLSDLSAPQAKSRLSGLLVGAELAAAQPYWQGQEIVLLGEGAVTRAYEIALKDQGAAPRCAHAETMTLAGLVAAYDALKGGQI